MNARQVSNAVAHTLLRQSVRPGEVSVLLTTDEAMHELNLNYRQVDATTDVLTFVGPDLPMAPIGDIVISLDTAQRQAESHGHLLQHETEILAIHGALHLAGWDDQTEEEYRKMMVEMGAIAAELNLPWDGRWSTHEVTPS